ncbi:hypothetical protein T12_6777 [Trichinella patagoniensis]|uniref:Uncharacterized protein n=1 Tax=Trichinella patagoniensis TaxID=990121 RepID=A0A0V0ZI08_9BILA|nr:hypothetical protein T12_6777 [Trichinella patagoniensis]
MTKRSGLSIMQNRKVILFFGSALLETLANFVAVIAQAFLNFEISNSTLRRRVLTKSVFLICI